MIRVNFKAVRGLIGLHESGDFVTLTFSPADLTPGLKVTRDVQKSMSGRRETLLHSALRTWSVSTEPLANETLDAMLEFLESATAGDTFSFEAWRHESGPSLDLDFVIPRLRVAESASCVLDSEGYSLMRLVGEGNGGADDWYQVNFTVDEVPA